MKTGLLQPAVSEAALEQANQALAKTTAPSSKIAAARRAAHTTGSHASGPADFGGRARLAIATLTSLKTTAI